MLLDATPHLIVPFASCGSEEWLQLMQPIQLVNLAKLLRGMKLTATDTGPAASLSPSHERVWANALQLESHTDGLIPWAALQANAQPGQGWAFLAPCHWAMGREHATLTDPETLGLTEEDSLVLLAAMQPYFATEGITLHYLEPARWLAEGDVFIDLPAASLDRVLGRNVDQWLPASRAIKLLQNEMQMLLYTHPVNDKRAAIGQRSVNSFWISASGALNKPATVNPQVNINIGLKQPALAGDWTAYAAAWTQLDATDIAQLLAQQNSGKTVRISLCGESNAMTFETTPGSILSKIKSVLSPQRPIYLLKQL